MKQYFVKIWKDGDILELKDFYSLDALFEWMQDNRDTKFALYEAKCILDYS